MTAQNEKYTCCWTYLDPRSLESGKRVKIIMSISKIRQDARHTKQGERLCIDRCHWLL